MLKLLLKIAGWFAISAAVICLIVALCAYLHARAFMRSASRAQGTVTRVEKRADHDADDMYYPVVGFRDARGVEQELFSSVGSVPPSHKVGDTVAVLYLADQPQSAKLDEFFDLWGLAAVCGGLGVFWLVVGLALLLVPVILRRSRPAAQALAKGATAG